MKKMCVCRQFLYNQKRKRKIMMSKENIITHVLNRIKSIEVSKYPFYNLYIENIFPEDFYEKLKKIMLYHKYNSPLEKRNWDNPDFINKKISLKNVEDDIIDIVKVIFDDLEIKRSFIEKFYINPNFIDEIVFENDLQFVFTEKNRFQKIHTDIPAQFLSVVFYLPEDDNINEYDELNNGTILYDKNLKPIKLSKFKGNSVSCFAPHFYSYHGFDTTINNRNTMQFFYAQKDLIKRFYDNSKNQNGEQNVELFKNVIQWKITKYRLLEYGKDDMIFLIKLT
jgi:hypothetical protein